MKIEIPEKIEKTLYVYMYVSDLMYGHISIRTYKSGDEEMVLLFSFPLSIEVPPDVTVDSVINNAVEVLKKHQSSIRAEYQVKLNSVQEKIDSFLAIENNPGGDE